MEISDTYGRQSGEIVVDRPIPFITRVRLKDFRSFAQCDVGLGSLTVVVGPNASGKSVFISSLAFMARAMGSSIYEALDSFGGLDGILRRGPRQATSFGIEVEASVRWGPNSSQWAHARYGFEVGQPPGYGIRAFEVLHEVCHIRLDDREWGFRVRHGEVIDESMAGAPPKISPDSLYLPIAARSTTYAMLFNGLSSMQFYDEFYRVSVETASEPVGGAVLQSHGENLADVLASLAVVRPDLIERINDYLRAISHRTVGVDTLTVGKNVAVVFRQEVGSEDDEVEFQPAAVSAGTLNAAFVLAALFQLSAVDGRISLVAMEEPGIRLHAAAAGVLFDALAEASEHVQVIVTNHSSELLDRDVLDSATILVTRMESGASKIGEIDRASRAIVNDSLYTVGELIRSDQVGPETEQRNNKDSSSSRD